MLKKISLSKKLSIGLIALIVSIPLIVSASAAATGSITGVLGMFYNETFTISDGTTSYNFVARMFTGSSSGQCVNGLTDFMPKDQPCGDGSYTIMDFGGSGGSSETTRATNIAYAINATAIGVTATANGTTVDLVNDTPGASGNVDITETVSSGSFVVTGMSGGTDTAAVPEFSTYLYMMTLAAGAWYVVNHFSGTKQTERY